MDAALRRSSGAALRLAREMTTDVAGSREAFEVVDAALGHELTTELVLVIGYYNMVVRYLETVQIDVEPEYETYLERFPLPQA